MSQKLKYCLFFGALALLIIGCSVPDQTREEKLKRAWQVAVLNAPDGETVNFIDREIDFKWVFGYNKDTRNNYFQRIHPGSVPGQIDTAFGSWQLLNDTTLKLLYLRKENDVLGLKVEGDPAGDEGISLYDERGNKLGSINHKGEFTAGGIATTYEILSFREDLMQLSGEEGIFHLTYEAPAQVSYISFETIVRGILGMLVLLAIAYLFSTDRKAINWGLVLKGLALQIVIALLVLKVPFVSSIFDSIAYGFKWLTDQTGAGTTFLLDSFADDRPAAIPEPLINFAFTILPTIIFFSALMSLLYYWGILQKIVLVFAWVMKRFMKLSGAESLAAAGNVFLGQTESPLLIKPYLMGMTRSEIMCLMTGGMATVAGGVLASYISFLGDGDPAQEVFYAKHLLTASIISAPAAVIAAKMLVPEKETVNQDLKVSKEKIGSNTLEAIANGTTDGLKLAVNVGAMLLVFTALIALVNGLLGGIGDYTQLNGTIAENTTYSALSLEMILGYVCGPLMWVLGIESSDMWSAGELLGIKTISNEFIGYIRLSELKKASPEAGGISNRTAIMCTYMLCGFANFASIGIQIGGIGSLVPSRKGLLSSLGFKALIGGTLACLFTMVVVGMLI